MAGCFFAGTHFRKPPLSQVDAAVAEEFFTRMEDVQSMDLVRADYLRKAAGIKGPQWRVDDVAKLTPYFELHDVLVGAGRGILMAEASGHSSKMGITLLARCIRATVRRSEQDFAAAARFIRRGTYWYLLDNPDIYEKLRAQGKSRPEPEEIILVDPARWAHYMRTKVYRPRWNPENWEKTLLREVKKGEG